MEETLVRISRRIEGLPDYMPKKELMGEAWKRVKATNKLVRDCMEGETTFYREFQKLLGAYNSGKIYTPYSLPRDFNEKVADLEKCIGDSPVKEGINTKINNPIGMSGIGILSFAGMIAVMDVKEYRKNKEKMTRRKFIENGFLAIGAGIIGGGAIGGMNASFKKGKLGVMEYSAKYLDDIYDKYLLKSDSFL